ncbi:putative OPA3-like protein CG13603 [Leguminivora glycinivorella]|uniref:putative OPA3-like protein CG13603 n=1 Tax=Leguminivora glycinivorella TaxID=1035111 RepID=UPI00200BF0B2|nr:putative OPA3-like protein CG13603 [Leguminivora glycinivorella]
MVVGAFPIAKLSVLLIKQISKPIANACKERAKNSPFFRTYVCMPPAQFYNWCEVKAKMWILNLGRPVNIPVLSQEMAIELGANLLGESVIFVIGASLLIVEYGRQSKKEAAKEQARIDELKHITNTITDLYFAVQQQETQIREMERLIHSVSGKKIEAPPPDVRDITKSLKELEELTTSKSSPPKPPAGQKSPKGTPMQPPANEQPPARSQECDKMIRHEAQLLSTPYPDKGLILQSLNYIQMDVFSSIFPHSRREEEKKHEEKKIQSQKRDNAVLSEALYNIENNFKSLF